MSHGQARSIYAQNHDVEFTYPMSVRKVNHPLTQDELAVGRMPTGYWADNNMDLCHDNQLDDFIAEFEAQQAMQESEDE